jgi:glutamate-1-semialdehyde 2,1-aminomutase
MGIMLEDGLKKVLEETGTLGVVQRAGSMLSVFFGCTKVANYGDVRKSDKKMFAKFFHAMLRRGVHVPPSHCESWFISTKHTKELIRATVQAAKGALSDCNVDMRRSAC